MLEGRRQRPALPPFPGAALAGTQLDPASLSGDERQQLEDAALPTRKLKAHSELIPEGAATDQLLVIVAGWGCRYKTTRDGSRQIVGVLVPGDVANLDALMFGSPGYGVRILDAAQVVAIPRDRIVALAERYAGIARMLMRLALVENSVLSQWALGLGRQSAQQRLSHLLCELGTRLAGGEADADSFDLPLTQEQLADVLGLTAVHVNRTLQHLRSRGLIATAHRTISLPDVAALRRLAGFDPAYLHIAPAADSPLPSHAAAPGAAPRAHAAAP